MAEPSYQTVHLTRGSHSSPREGVCVMELASMLAGEHFDDHPRAVCPVIGMLARAYNDAIDDRRRQDLYTVAADLVGTRSRAAIGARLDRAAEFLGVEHSRWSRFAPRARRLSLARSAWIYGHNADDRAHAAFLGLIGELTAVGAARGVAGGRSARALGFLMQRHGVQERQVRQGLREVPEQLPARRIDLLRQQSDVVRVADHRVDDRGGLVGAPGA